MLIVSGQKQKPARWPIRREDVWWAAEHVLGIDQAELRAVFPFWSGAGGVKNIIGNDIPDLGSPDDTRCWWNNEGIWFNNTPDTTTPPITVDTSGSGFWYDEFSELTIVASTYMDATGPNGPYVLIDIGGGVNGLCIGYRINPDQFTFVAVNAETYEELYCGKTYLSGDINVAAAFLSGTMRLMINGDDLTTTTALFNTIPFHSSDPGIGGADSSYAYQAISSTTEPDDWYGTIKCLALIAGAIPEEAEEYLTSYDPYILIRRWPRPWYFDLAAGTSYALSGTISAAAALSGAASLRATLAGAAVAVSAASGDLAVSARLSGTLGAQAVLSASARVTEALSGAMAAVATLAAEAREAVGLSGTVSATADMSADARLAVALAGAIQALATLTGDLTAGNILQLSGTISAASSLSAEAAMAATLAGNLQAYAELLDATARAEMKLQGAVEAASAAQADARLTETLSGLCAAVSELTGSLLIVGESLGILTDPVIVDVTRRWHLLPVSRRFKIHRA